MQFNGEPGLADDQPDTRMFRAAPPQEAQEKRRKRKTRFQVYGFAQLDSGYDSRQ